MDNDFVYGGNVVGFSDLQTCINGSSTLSRIPKEKHPGWDRTIFCIVDNEELEQAIQKCAGELNCKVLFDIPTSPELIFDHHFVAVVEAGAVDEETWDLYVEFCNDGDINVPCLLVGDTNHFNMPETNNIISFSSCSPESIHRVVITIRAIRKNTINISLL